MARLTRRFLIAGKVQGVFFRDSTRRLAERLSIHGHARNLDDGSVEVLAHGEASALDELREWLNHGPQHARVDGVREAAAVTVGADDAVQPIAPGFLIL